MKVAIAGKVIELPDRFCMDDLETSTKFSELKKLVEDDFFILFDRKIDIVNWDYILNRTMAYYHNGLSTESPKSTTSD